MDLVRLLVEALVVRHLVFGVDHAVDEVSALGSILATGSSTGAIGAATEQCRLCNWRRLGGMAYPILTVCGSVVPEAWVVEIRGVEVRSCPG